MSTKKKKDKEKDQETKVVKKVDSSEKKEETKKNKGSKKRKKHPKLRMFFKIIFIIFILLFVIGAGIGAALVYRCIWGDWAITEKELDIQFQNSKMYDKNGNVIAVLTGEENREIISKDQMSEYLPKAFIAIEDRRFESHHGVDWKMTLGAFTSFLTHAGESSYGGSTLTQQVVKNLTQENECSGIDGALRKVKEIVRAYEVENILSKDQIVELYMNLIPLGGGGKNIYGVQTASRYYFDKNASELSLVESAYIAGITHAPNRYNPFGENNDNTETIKERVKKVLGNMKELGSITEEEYNNAIAEVEAGINFKQGEVSQNNKLTYYLEEARTQILNDLMEENGWSLDIARLHLYGEGYNIYTAFDPEVQAQVDAQFVDNAKKWYVVVKRKNSEGQLVDVQRQGAMVVIDNETGYIVAGSGGLGEKTTADGTNRMNIKGHNPGSCIKPIAVVGPSLNEGLITLGSTIDDTPVSYGSYNPNNWYMNGGYYGFMTMRYIIEKSSNVPEVKMLHNLGLTKSLEYLANMGVDVTGEEDDGLALALGGMAHGLTAIEMATCYATIQNGGVYRTPLLYTKITNQDGETIYEPKQETRQVFTEQNAWLLTDLLKQPIYGAEGTGGKAAISGQQVRGKTGTTNNDSAAWFCGFTKYYTASVWLGFDREADGNAGGNADSGICGSLFRAVMTPVHAGKPSADWPKPAGIVSATVCSVSGLLPGENCEHDPRGSRLRTEYFASGTVPTKTCDLHVTATVCKVSGKLATENCKETETGVFITRHDATTNTGWKKAVDAKYMAPTEECTDCVGGAVKEPEPPREEPVTPQTPSDNNTATGNNTVGGNNTNQGNTNTNTSTNTPNTNHSNTNTNQSGGNTNTNQPNSNTNTNTETGNGNTNTNQEAA